MKVTKVKIKKIKREKGKILVGFADILLDNCLAIHNIAILEGKKGYFIGMPNKKNKKVKYSDVVHPINTEFRNELTAVIVEALKKEGVEVINEK